MLMVTELLTPTPGPLGWLVKQAGIGDDLTRQGGAMTVSSPSGMPHSRCQSAGVTLRVREIGHGADGRVTRCTSMISSPRPTIRSTSPGRAAWSGSSARRVVVSGLVVTWQSSNCARSVRPAWPVKVISYVCDRTG